MIDWSLIHKVLLVRLRSIGDTVLMTPCLMTLKQFRPDLHVSVLLEKSPATLLRKHPQVDEVILLDRTNSQWANGRRRWKLISRLRRARFDIAFNLHGGTTGTFLCCLSGARHTVGYRGYRWSALLDYRAPDPEAIWQKAEIHSVEQQLGLLKWSGVPVGRIPATALYASEAALRNATRRLSRVGITGAYALIHPGGTSRDKRWPIERFARVIEHLATRHDIRSLVIGTRHEREHLCRLEETGKQHLTMVTDLHLKELVALSSMATLFVGNDSGPAHIAMSQRCPTIVIFGSSDSSVWRPWGDSPHAVVQAETDPSGRRVAPGQRIHQISHMQVMNVVDRLLATAKGGTMRLQSQV